MQDHTRKLQTLREEHSKQAFHIGKETQMAQELRQQVAELKEQNQRQDKELQRLRGQLQQAMLNQRECTVPQVLLEAQVSLVGQ